MKGKATGVAICAISVIIVGGVGWMVWNARVPLSKRSEGAVSAMLTGNAGALMKYATDREIR